MKEVIISKNDEGQRFDKYLNKYLKNASTGFIYKMLRKKNITLNGKKSEGKEILKAGDTVKIFFSDETFDKFKGTSKVNTVSSNFSKKVDIPIIYENDDLIFLNKPAGILSQSDGSGNFSINEWLISYLKSNNFKFDNYTPGVCNRLDRNTSGIIIAAKTYKGSRYMFDLISNHKLSKYYYALCEGILKDEITLKGYLNKNEKTNKVSINQDKKSDDDQYIETIIMPEKAIDNNTLVLVKLITGKTHQIRAHLSSINHPLCGDIKYGGHKYGSYNYQLLHSTKLQFPEEADDICGMSGKLIECKPKWLK